MVLTIHKTGPWNLTDLETIPKNGFKVFSAFHCGGGSTMGYKLSGYEVLGGIEIDPEMMQIYKANHNPKLSYLMGVQDFNKIPKNELPQELFNLDILDGSPPCSSFSMAGSREKAWGQKKKFREGQAIQVLDDLFFHFIETARKLQPKIVVAENVKGLIQGKAKGYVKEINTMFNLAGYTGQLFLLNAAFMGVPQKRERTFFIYTRKDLKMPKLNLKFNEDPISVEKCTVDINTIGKPLNTILAKNCWFKTKPGNGLGIIGKFNSQKKLDKNVPAFTQTASSRHWHWEACNEISNEAVIRIQTFPDDFKFFKQDVHYFCGMSVPPYMMNRISKQIELQLLKNEV